MQYLQYSLLKTEDVEEYWALVAPWILLAMDHKELDAELSMVTFETELQHVHDRAVKGELLIWVGHPPKAPKQIEMVLVCESVLHQGDRGHSFVIRYLSAKKLSDFIHDLDFLETWAQKTGFEYIEIRGRKGWFRKLRKRNYVKLVSTGDLVKYLGDEI